MKIEKEKSSYCFQNYIRVRSLITPKLENERRATIMSAMDLFVVVSGTIVAFTNTVKFIVWIIDRKYSDQ